MNAALPATTSAASDFELHLSTHLPGGLWSVELRQPGAKASLPYTGALAGTALFFRQARKPRCLRRIRLWIAGVALAALDGRGGTPGAVAAYLARHGLPIRYSYVRDRGRIEVYQTVFANEPGSAEMPSAGRPFTPELVTALVSRGVGIAPLVLHTGVSSLESHEPPYEEFYRVPRDTAQRVNAAKRAGGRVIAVGTTVVRALETVTDDTGTTSPGEGWTDLVITSERPLRSVTD